MIKLPHGGPWARDHFGYDAFAQFLSTAVTRFYSPICRGSTGYGESYLNAGNGERGRKMQDDLTGV